MPAGKIQRGKFRDIRLGGLQREIGQFHVQVRRGIGRRQPARDFQPATAVHIQADLDRQRHLEILADAVERDAYVVEAQIDCR